METEKPDVMSREEMHQALAETGGRSPYMGTFTPGRVQSVPEFEVKRIPEGGGLAVVEHPGELDSDHAERIKSGLQAQGIEHPIILDGGAHLNILTPRAGDVVTVKVHGHLCLESHRRLVAFLKETLEAKGINAPILVAEESADISLMDEEIMRQMGWVRAPVVAGR